MKRKVIQIANSTQLVSLPRRWSINNKIKKGCEVDVDITENKVVISTEGHHEPAKISFNADNISPMLIRYISALYKSGADEIEMSFSEEDPTNALSREINELLPGYEVLSHTSKNIMIKDLAWETNPDLDSVIKRIFFVTISMAENVNEWLAQKDKSLTKEKIESTLALEKTNNRLCNYCMRHLHKNGYGSPSIRFSLYTTIYEMEKIGDELKYLCQYLISLSDSKKAMRSHDVKKYFSEVLAYMKDLMKIYYKPESKGISYIGSERKRLIQSGFSLMDKATKEEERIIFNSMNIVQSLFCTSPMICLSLEQNS